MANALVDNSRIVNEAGLDGVSANGRTRATLANPLGVNWIDGAGAPTTAAPGATVTITAAALLTGIATYNPSTGNTATFDTAANIVSAINGISAGAVVGDYICILVINGSASNTITLAAGTGGSFDTNQPNRGIAVNQSKWVIIRLTNVTPASEAYTIYF